MTPSKENPPLAISIMVLATIFVAATMILAKALGTDTLGPPLHPLQVSHGRFVFALVGILAVLAVIRPKLEAMNLRLHIARSIAGWLGVSLMFASVTFIPLPDATAISFLNPVFAMVLAIPLLGEKVGPIRWIAAGIALIGALILLRPGPDTFQVAAFLALGAAALFGFEIICIKRLSAAEPPLQILLINNLIGLTLSSIAVLFVWHAPTPSQWVALIALGLIMALAQACYINAVARADASLVLPFSYSTLIFAALYDWAIFANIPDQISILGACVIIAGAALLAYREATRTKS